MIKLGNNKEARILQGNTLNLLNEIPDNYFQLIITSPPYNIGKEYEKRTSIEEYVKFQSKIIKKCVSKLKDSGSIVWQVGNYSEKGEEVPLDYLFYPIFKKHKLILRNRIIWHFGHGWHATKKFSNRCETCLWFTKTDNYVFNLDAVRIPSKCPNKKYYKGPKKGQLSGNPLGKNPSNFWTLEKVANEFMEGLFEITNVKHGHPEKTGHPCQFPVELVERFILALTNEGDYVLDPYGGSGSTVIASVKNNRFGVMCEKEDRYVNIAVDRVNKCLKGTLKTLPIKIV